MPRSIFMLLLPILFIRCANPVEEDLPFLLYKRVSTNDDGTVTVRWSTGVPTLGVVEVARTPANYYTYQYAAGARYDTVHSVRMIGLTSESTWFYRVRSTALNGTLLISEESTFSTGTVTYDPRTLRLHMVDITDPCQSFYNPGDNFFIEFPNGKTMMYDSGDRDGSPTIIAYIHALGYDSVNYGVLTHGHYDHYAGYLQGGIATALWFGHFLQPNTNNDPWDFDDVFNSMKSLNPGIGRTSLSRGASPVLNAIDPQVQITVVSAGADTLDIDPDNGPVDNSKTNNASLTMKFTFGQASFLMTGDLEKEASRKFIEQNPVVSPVVDVLKVPHHCRADAVTDGLLAATNPVIAIASTQNCNCGGLMECDAADLIVGRHIDFYRADLADPNANRLSPRSGIFKSHVVLTTDGATITMSHRE